MTVKAVQQALTGGFYACQISARRRYITCLIPVSI